MAKTETSRKTSRASGRLRIGDDWNAITIIALSQSNPLKALAEFVENSIDAGARHVAITRGRERGEPYLNVSDDGEGIRRNEQGIPDFHFVATHICDSIKRRLKADGAKGIQGEFGIGLLSFWTVGDELLLTSGGADGKTYQMRMRKGDPSYTLSARRALFPQRGVELRIRPLLSGTRHFSGEKIQWYLASELRDRIRQSGVRIRIVDRQARKQYDVQPRQFGGHLLRQLPVPRTPHGEIYLELYLSERKPENRVALCRGGTRVLESLTGLEAFQRFPWNEGALEGIVDAGFLNLTPGTRTGIVYDEAFTEFSTAMGPVSDALGALIEEQRRAEEERASRQILRTIQKAFREALLALPPEEYDWFDVRANGNVPRRPEAESQGMVVTDEREEGADAPQGDAQKAFFDYPGPLFSVRISPASSVLPVGRSRTFRAVARDRERRLVDQGLAFEWRILEGGGALADDRDETVTFAAPDEPGLTRLAVTVTDGETTCEAESLVTVTDSLMPEKGESAGERQGLPGYTYKHAPGELWRSAFDIDQNVIVINSGHRDFVFASRSRALKLRYIARLFAKELVYRNFPGYSAGELLERMVELLLYTEENLK